MVEGVDHVRLGRAPAAREVHELPGTQHLPRKDDEPMLVQRRLDEREGPAVERPREVGAGDAGAEHFGDPADFHRVQSPAARKPPSTRIVSPVTKAAAGDAR